MKQKVSGRRRRQNKVSNFQAEFSRSAAPAAPSLAIRIRRTFLILTATAILITAGYWLLFARVEISGESFAVTEDTTDGAVFLPAFDAPSFAEDIRRRHPAVVADVSIKHEWWERRLLVTVEARSTQLILRTQGEDYSIDGKGIVVGAAQDSGREDRLPLLFDESNLPVETGGQAVPAQLVEFITDLNESTLEYDRLRIIDTSSELYADLGAGYSARFATGEPFDVQFANLSRVQQVAEQAGHPITEYVDLRIPYKAYYR